MSETDRRRSEARRASPHYEARRRQAEEAQRSWRFKAATARIKKIVDGAPPLTEQQRATLARLLLTDAGDSNAQAT